MPLDWYPFFVAEYRRDTYHLSPMEHHAYRTLIDEYMFVLRGPLPNDDAALAKIIGIPATEWDLVKERVRPFFKPKNDRLIHKRCEQELNRQKALSARYRERAKKGGEAKAFKDKMLRALSTLNPATIQDKDKITTTEYVPREGQPRKDVASPELKIHEGGKRR